VTPIQFPNKNYFLRESAMSKNPYFKLNDLPLEKTL